MSLFLSEKVLKSQSIILSKEVWIGWISSLIEAYNMAIFSFLAPFLAPIIFQNTDDFKALLFSYLLVFLGYCFLYPLGALYYGGLGDRFGRREICVYSTLGLGITTGVMGILPDEMLIGGWIYFLILTGAQYFFSGGEYYGSIIFSLEHSSHEKQLSDGLMSALSCLFAVFGLILANGLAILSFQMDSIFWIRTSFILGAFGGILSYILKRTCRETPAYSLVDEELKIQEKMHVFIGRNFSRIFLSVCIFAFFMVSYSFIFIFLPLIEFKTNYQEFSTFKALIGYGLFLVLSGIIADKISVKKTMSLGLILFSIFIFPLTFFSKDLLLIQMILTPCACLVIGPLHSFMLQQFKVHERCRGVFTSSAIAMLVFGGSTPPICLMIFEISGSLGFCSLYPFAIAMIALFSLIFFGRRSSNESCLHVCPNGNL